MKLPRDLSGEQLVKHLCRRWEYRQVHQIGSHVILETSQPGLSALPFRNIILFGLAH
jgi:predicted RNA binding protein YcfA (HicA-like mRNA interferase family)